MQNKLFSHIKLTTMKSYAFPGNINEKILQIGSQQIPYMRTTEFSTIVLELEFMLNSMINNPDGKVIPYTASGTGAMDSVVCNYVTTHQKALIIDGGSFGHRWYDLCKYYGCDHYVHKVDFAKDINYKNLEEDIIREKPNVLLCQQHETSTGQLFNIEKIGNLCKKYNVSLVVDAISSFLADFIDMKSWNIDICITSSQKGLNIPPGLSFIFLSSRLKDFTFAHNSFYFDFQTNLKNLERGQTPYSPATVIFLQAYTRCKQILNNGGVNVLIEQVKNRAYYFRELCHNNQWHVPAENPSNAITGFYINKNESILFRKLIEEYNTFIMPGSISNYFRVSHMGEQNKRDLEELVAAIKYIESK